MLPPIKNSKYKLTQYLTTWRNKVKNVRDCLYVVDHCTAILTALRKGEPGQTYNVGGNNEKQNIEIVSTICDLLD